MTANRISDDATKHFCEIQPATEPSDAKYYQNLINTRRFTLANITQLCKLYTVLPANGSIMYLLESSIRTNNYSLVNNTSVVKKCIFQVDYLFDVWVKEWSVVCVYDLAWDALFQWQASHDKSLWVDIGREVQTEKVDIRTSMMSAENGVEWVFPNPAKETTTKYKYWRAFGTRGTTVNGFINVFLMNISQ
jgi:hypothetical protein